MGALEVDDGWPRQMRGGSAHLGRKSVKGRMTNADQVKVRGNAGTFRARPRPLVPLWTAQPASGEPVFCRLQGVQPRGVADPEVAHLSSPAVGNCDAG